jgi:hypothetical protein
MVLRPALLRRAPVLAAPLLAACGPLEETPDGVWEVTVRSEVIEEGGSQTLATDCVDQGAVFEKTFLYELYAEDGGSGVELKINGESFAIGTRQGCRLTYQSAVWLEERPSGQLQWQIAGVADYQGAIGGCDLPEGLDWFGEETIEIVASEDEEIPAGCTYGLLVEGTLKSGG